MAVSPVIFVWPLRSDDATLSGGSWGAATPLTKLQNPRLSSVARSTNDDATSTIINVDFGAAVALSVVALVRHNLTKDAEWRIRGSANSDMSSAVYDSTQGDVFAEQWAASTLPSGHPNASDRLLSNADLAAIPLDAVQVFTEATARYWRIELFDTSNPDGYVEIGRLVMGPRFQPTYQFGAGAEVGLVDKTTLGESHSGVRFYDESRGPVSRTLSLPFPALPQNEAVQVVRDMQARLGTSGQLYVVATPDSTTDLNRNAFLANLRQLSPVQLAGAGWAGVSLTLDEVR